ncbi:MAG: NHL repeat-containing protein [Caldisericaceae bacterium]|nr:NHL repeat-containing protein [Caldisericaceae bacterium]
MFKFLFLILVTLFFNSKSLFSQTFVEEFRLGQEGQQSGQFNRPLALAVSQDGVLFVVDSGNNRLQLFDLEGHFLKTVGGFGFEADQFDFPTDIWTKSLINIYVSDYNNQRIQRYDRQMNYIAQFSSNPNWPEEFQFGQTLSCAVNSQNDLFILDHQENKVIKFNRNGQPERFFGHYDSGPGELSEPVQLDLFLNNYLLVSDIGRKAIVMFDFFGNFIKLFSDSQFVRPRGLACTKDDLFFVADEGAKMIFSLTSKAEAARPWNLILQQPLSSPADLVTFSYKKATRAVILDGHQLIWGRLELDQ